MDIINIIDIIKTPNAIIHKYGISIYNIIKPYLEKNEQVTLSFKGLKNVTSGFCNASIGKLYSEFPKAKDLLHLSSLENYLWKEKVESAISLAKNPYVSEIYTSAISEPFAKYNVL